MTVTTISVTDSSGTPQSVSTMDALLADGGQLTIGAKADASQTDATQTASLMAFLKGLVSATGQKADAKSTATDTTPVTHTSILKQISASVQLMVFGAGTAAAAQRTTLASDDPAVAVLGAKADAKNTATDTTSISIMSVLKQVSASVQLMVFGAGTAAAAQRVTLASDDPVTQVLGGKTDAKNTATDTTSVSHTSILKQISASVQLLVFGAGTAAAAQRTTLASDDPAVATLGATSGAKVITDSNGTLQQYLRGLVSLWIGGLAAGEAHVGSMADAAYVVASMGNFTRPADTTAYTAGDLVANSVTAGSVVLLTCSSAGRVSGGNGEICGARLQKSTNATTNAQFRLHLFGTIPTVTTNGDNSPISGNIVATGKGYLGFVDITAMTGFSDVAWAAGAPDNSRQRIPYVCTAQSIFGVLEARGAYTPGSAEVFTIDLLVHQN